MKNVYDAIREAVQKYYDEQNIMVKTINIEWFTMRSLGQTPENQLVGINIDIEKKYERYG